MKSLYACCDGQMESALQHRAASPPATLQAVRVLAGPAVPGQAEAAVMAACRQRGDHWRRTAVLPAEPRSGRPALAVRRDEATGGLHRAAVLPRSFGALEDAEHIGAADDPGQPPVFIHDWRPLDLAGLHQSCGVGHVRARIGGHRRRGRELGRGHPGGFGPLPQAPCQPDRYREDAGSVSLRSRLASDTTPATQQASRTRTALTWLRCITVTMSPCVRPSPGRRPHPVRLRAA